MDLELFVFFDQRFAFEHSSVIYLRGFGTLWLLRSENHQAEVFDSKAGAELLDIILKKYHYGGFKSIIVGIFCSRPERKVVAVPEDVGTTGALRAIGHHLTTHDILVMSGDLVCDVPPGAVAAAHRRHDAVVTAMLCSARVSGPSDSGSAGGKDKCKKPGRYNIIGLDPTQQFLLFIAAGAEVEKDIRVQKSILRAVGQMNGDDDSVAKMKAAEDALQEKEKALIHGLNRHYYSIAINYRKNELEEKMLLNLHKKKWTDGLTLQRFDTHSKTNEQTVQKQMSVMVTVLVTKEGKRLETALGRSMEKAVKANTDALWAHFQEENAKQEKLVRERTQQITSLITNCINKDLPAMVEKTVKKELAAVGPAVARAISPAIEKTISTAITEAFQRGVGDKAVNQLEKSVNSKLEATVARQIQAQFQTSGKQALQDALKSSLEASVIPAFEMSCKAMFEQVDATFQKGMIEHATVAQQQFETRFEFGGLCFMTRWMDFSF
ncbi:unnamed protein product [Camellia sinensis]